MPSLPVRGLPKSDAGRLLVRLNHKYRQGIARYGIARLTNQDNGKSKIVLVLRHDDDSAIFMPYDIRDALGVSKQSQLNLSIQTVSLWGKLRWYVMSPDPAVHVPAWIAVGGIILAVAGLILGVVSAEVFDIFGDT